MLCLEQGIFPVYHALGAAGALFRYMDEMGLEQTVENARKELCEISGLRPDHALTQLILAVYPCFQDGETSLTMRRTVQEMKARSLTNVI
mgnify:CR=1 FL=1